MKFPWRYPWRAIEGEEAAALETELRREMVRGHALYERVVRAIARRDDCDDVAFRVDGERLCVVHLTWTAEREPSWHHAEFVDALTQADEEDPG